MDSPRDLFSLISASARCFRVYNESPERTLSSVLRNAVLPDAFPHAIAAFRAAAAAAPGPRQAESLEAFLNEYFQTDSLEFPVDKEGMVALCRLCSRTSYFVDGYSTRAIRALGLERDAELCLSPTERARFQRAFFRYELYSRVYPVDHSARRSRSRVPADAQFTQFLARIEPWEAEEMSCVHHYFTSLIGEFIDDLEHDVVQSVLTAPGVRRPPGSARPRSSSPEPPKRRRIPATTAGGWMDDSLISSSKTTWTEDGEGQSNAGDDMEFFDCLDLRILYMFSKEGRFRSPRTIGYLVSLGSAFIYRLALADENERRDILLRNAPPEGRHFLPEALEYAPGILTETVIPSEVDDRDISRPNLGWYLFKRADEELYFQISHAGIMNSPLRERAFVFWDADRISGRAVKDDLQRAGDMDPEEVDLLFDRSTRKSAEERLEGVRIPRAQMERIDKEFGSTFEFP